MGGRGRLSALMVVGLLVATAGSAADIPAAPERVTLAEVLVLYNSAWPDEDGNHRSDSLDVAEYYAARRGIPRDHLLGLAVTERESRSAELAYPDFVRRVLVPTRRRLAELAARGTHIHYLVTCYGMPLGVRTKLDGKQNEHPMWKPTDADADTRALGGWLVNVEENFQAGYDAVTGKPGPRGGTSAAPGSGPLGSALDDIALAWIRGAFERPDATLSFKKLRAASPARRETYLVTHLGGETLDISRGLVDKALYAERYLQNVAGRPALPYHGRVWLDHDGGSGAGHRSSLVATALWFKGLTPASVFSPANRAQPWYQGPPWDVRMDNAKREIGSRTATDPAAPLHVATVSAVIERVDASARVVTLTAGGEPAPAVFFPVGEVVQSSGGGRAEVVAITSDRTLVVSTAAHLNPGETLTWRQGTRFPLTDVMFYYGYYGLGQYYDVYQFPVGAIGAHVDSASAVWARAAMRRGITATAGAVTEPANAGLPFMLSAFAALTNGHDVAEAFYSAIPYDTRWNTVIFGDPLYAPFRSRGKRADEVPPVIEQLTLTPIRAPRGGRSVRVGARLAAATPEQADDIALWQVEYGLTPEYGSLVPYVEWPDPGDARLSAGRRYSYTRRFTHELAGLLPGRDYHVRVSARDPFANVGTFTATVTTLP
jgi:uncharacterized protein (TIGR03790 family)